MLWHREHNRKAEVRKLRLFLPGGYSEDPPACPSPWTSRASGRTGADTAAATRAGLPWERGSLGSEVNDRSLEYEEQFVLLLPGGSSSFTSFLSCPRRWSRGSAGLGSGAAGRSQLPAAPQGRSGPRHEDLFSANTAIRPGAHSGFFVLDFRTVT